MYHRLTRYSCCSCTWKQLQQYVNTPQHQLFEISIHWLHFNMHFKKINDKRSLKLTLALDSGLRDTLDDQIFMILEDQILCPVVGELLHLSTLAARNWMVDDIRVKKTTVGMQRCNIASGSRTLWKTSKVFSMVFWKSCLQYCTIRPDNWILE